MTTHNTDTPTDINKIFDGTFDSLEALTTRKRAVAEPNRYKALFYAYTHQDETVHQDELPCKNINALLDANLLARIPTPSDRYIIRITTLGKHEIQGDLQFLTEATPHSEDDTS